jgi:hypothetical protein
MMRFNQLQRWLVVPVILLFVGVVLAPSIQSYEVISAQNKFVEITIDAVGLPGLRSQTVKLNEEQLANLESVLSSVDQKLSQASTTAKAAEIVEDAIGQLHPFGFFGSVGVQQAKRLVMGRYHNERTHLWNERINQVGGNNGRITVEYLNRCCFIFYRLASDSDCALSIFVPFWVQYIVDNAIDDFATLALFKMLLSVPHFMTNGMVTGDGFQIKTFGLYGPVMIDIDDYGDVTLRRFTGLRLQYHFVRPGNPMLPFFEKGFLLGYANSIS